MTRTSPLSFPISARPRSSRGLAEIPSRCSPPNTRSAWKASAGISSSGFALELPEGALLVFDNYQEVSTDSRLHDVVRAGLERVPHGLNLVVVSRFPPPPVLARQHANGQMAVMDWSDLRLTDSEADAIVALRETVRRRVAREGNPLGPKDSRVGCRIGPAPGSVADRGSPAGSCGGLHPGDHVRLFRVRTARSGNAGTPNLPRQDGTVAESERRSGRQTHRREVPRAHTCSTCSGATVS